MKGDKMAKGSSFGTTVRRRLSDITNSLPNPKGPPIGDKFSPGSSSDKDYIDKLVKENLGLTKLIQDKNKIIELSGIEIQNLKTCLQKMQMQNWNLAQSNNFMLAELNFGKEKLKALQHEIGCKEALLKAKNLQLKVNVENNILQEHKIKTDTNEDHKPGNGCRRQRPSRRRSLGHLASSQQVAENEETKTKRCCLRRQSATYRTQHQELNEDVFEIECDTFPDESYSMCSLEAEEPRRTSVGRPVRSAVEKVGSYKERPLNIKMRRT